MGVLYDRANRVMFESATVATLHGSRRVGLASEAALPPIAPAPITIQFKLFTLTGIEA